MANREVYLDHAATTPIDERVLGSMRPFLLENFGNPSSFHMMGKVVRDAIDDAREKVAVALGARPDEILFTSGGSESDNLAVLGVARAHIEHGKHIVSLRTEHQAVAEPLYHLEKKEGFEVTYVDVDREGLVDAQAVIDAIRPDTTLVTILYANNEIGVIQPISEIGNKIQKMREETKTRYPLFHTDACQAVGTLEVDVNKLHVDLMTINSSKIYGPKGVGALYVHRGIKLRSLQFGGAQERGIRPGTENVIGIVGFGTAIEIAAEEREQYNEKVTPLRDYCIEQLLSVIPKTRLNGHPTKRLANNVNISFMDVEGEALLLYLDASGIYASTGSACTSASLDPSHVILALGLPYEVAHGSLRFSLGRSTTKEDIDYLVATLPALVERLRKISPVSVDEKYFR
ncbi:aminotransferase class V-fold PLP-dependent enzyme [Candidatus Uhrbacteria bacterium]|jgi:cysteine desulfurase|nr:aminotransferase class V-fold PLP-dependent enzyme [Candidatus Uhrbacteria bacterium]